MNVLVTGATGFVGSYLVPALLEKGCNLRLLVRDAGKARKLFGDSCEVIQGNVENKGDVKGCCRDIDVVYHMAALMGHDLPSEQAFERFRRVNVTGTQNMIDEAKESHVKKFIHVSSTAALGLQPAGRVDENTDCNPYTPYQVTKREGELCVLNEAREGHLPAIVVRPSMVYGPGFKGDFLTMAKVCKTGFFPKIGRGENLSPALYITDLVNALVLLADKGRTGEIYMVSSQESYSLAMTAGIIGNSLNKKIHFIYIPRWLAVFGAGALEKLCLLAGRRPPVTQRNIQSVSTDRIVDISKAAADLGFAPLVSLEEGLPKAVKYFKEQHYM